MIELKKIVDEAVKMSGCVEKVLVWQRLGKKDLKGIDVDLEKEVGNQSKEMEAPSMNAEDPLFMLYTSGSTGKPKGILHFWTKLAVSLSLMAFFLLFILDYIWICCVLDTRCPTI